MKSHPHAGQVKMRGKRFKVFLCKCCVCQDFRDAYRKKLALKEIRSYESL